MIHKVSICMHCISYSQILHNIQLECNLFVIKPALLLFLECKADHCEVCSNIDFCEKCLPFYLEYRGTCILKCPLNLYHSKYRKDCYEKGL